MKIVSIYIYIRKFDLKEKCKLRKVSGKNIDEH